MKLLSVKEAAEVLGLSPGLVYALCAQKRLRHERHGLGRGKIKIPEDAIAEYRRSVTIFADGQAAVVAPQMGQMQLKHIKL
jgi:excisionase family DNA binding protein